MTEGAERSGTEGEQFRQIVDDWAKMANHLVTTSAALAKRMVRQEPGAPGPDGAGPLQDIWMTMAGAAGDMAELSYKWVQAVDGLSGFTPGRGPAPTPASSAPASSAPASTAPASTAEEAPGGPAPNTADPTAGPGPGAAEASRPKSGSTSRPAPGQQPRRD
jgi:hypothetical protein